MDQSFKGQRLAKDGPEFIKSKGQRLAKDEPGPEASKRWIRVY